MSGYWIDIQPSLHDDDKWDVIYKRPGGGGDTKIVDYDVAQLIEIARAAGKYEAQAEIRKALGI